MTKDQRAAEEAAIKDFKYCVEREMDYRTQPYAEAYERMMEDLHEQALLKEEAVE